jgi:hypothetical protein
LGELPLGCFERLLQRCELALRFIPSFRKLRHAAAGHRLLWL